jgi:hypothetical protein
LRLSDIKWSTKLLVVSGLNILALLAVGVVGGYRIFIQNRTTESVLKASQVRADAASKARVAILIVGRSEAQLLSASDPQERRTAAVIAATSSLDESIQRRQEALASSSKVAQLSRLLDEIGPVKMQVIKATADEKK